MKQELHEMCFAIPTLIICYAIMFKILEWLSMIPWFAENFSKAVGI